MFHQVRAALRRIQEDLAQILDARQIADVCREAGYRFRKRLLDPTGCGFPVAHILTLFHAGTGFLLKVLTAPLRTHDMAQAALLHPELEEGDVLIGDRAFSLGYRRKLRISLTGRRQRLLDLSG